MRISEHVRKTHSVDGGVILDVKRGQMFLLNFAGSRIIELVEQDVTPQQIAVEIADEFDISVDVAGRDAREFLNMLAQYDLIELQPVEMMR